MCFSLVFIYSVIWGVLTSFQFNSRVFDVSRNTWQNKSAPLRFLARVLYVSYGRVSSQTFPLVSFRQQSSWPVLNVDKRVSLKLWVISETKRAVYNREGLDLDWIRTVFIIQIASASQTRREKTQLKVISDYGKNTFTVLLSYISYTQTCPF